MYEHLRDECRKSSKFRLCDLCSLPIAKGEKYVRRTGAFEGKINTASWHTECHRMANTLPADFWENELDYNEIRIMLAKRRIVEQQAENKGGGNNGN